MIVHSFEVKSWEIYLHLFLQSRFQWAIANLIKGTMILFTPTDELSNKRSLGDPLLKWITKHNILQITFLFITSKTCPKTLVHFNINWVRPATSYFINGNTWVNFQNSILGYNFWLEYPTDQGQPMPINGQIRQF